jgi:7,8-dihydropterin-6-yl-methyl-4-(beta-D-ribofuranosyl)aminobenzene 5'-phosphate synthase
MNKQQITVLVENTAGGSGLLAEHGLSFLIELGSRKLLFDTGQGRVLKNNARQLGVALESIDSIVLSHGHWDHTGGLSVVLDSADNPKVYAHPEAFAPKYACDLNGSVRSNGISDLNAEKVRSKASMIWIEAPTEIGEGLWLTGPVPRTNDYEDAGGPFFKDKQCLEPDVFPDDQAAFLETKSGIVVILGCTHAGVINTLHFIQTLTRNSPIYAVIGGMHLVQASSERMEKTIKELKRLNIGQIMPCHCTGFEAAARLWNEFPGRCGVCPVGTVIDFRD